MGHSNAWSETTPAGTEDASTTDDYLRKHRLDLGERLEAILYGFNASSNADAENVAGVKSLPFYKQGSDPTRVTDYAHAYTKLVDGIPELFFQDDTNTALQMTSGGKLKSTDELVVDGASTLTGNVACAGTLDVDGNIDPTTYETTNGGFLDEDDMASDAANKVASQQSIKAYIDSLVASGVSGENESTGETSIGSFQLKWGKESVSGDATDIVDFTDRSLTDFDNACFNAQVSYDSSNNNLNNPCVVKNLFTNSITITNGDASTRTIFWFAVGH